MRRALGMAAAGGALLLQGCGGWQSVLDPRNPGAERIEGLWWFAFLSTGTLALIVIAGLLYALRRAGRAEAAREGGSVARREQRFILLAGAAFPAAFLVVFLTLSVRAGTVVSGPPGERVLTVEVIGHKFWWEIRYPDLGIVTANELHIPAYGAVEVFVTSADVIHSFWVPQIGPGKIDMNPGRTNRFWLLAEEPGRYRGQCTEFCGVQHALMSLLVVASEPGEFEAWVEARLEARDAAATPNEPETRRGLVVFFEAGCAACHAIEGASRPRAAGSPGPDLTHLASRSTLAALTISNDREHLRAWIEDPHQFKWGARMPGHPRLPAEDLDALVSYLETLR